MREPALIHVGLLGEAGAVRERSHRLAFGDPTVHRWAVPDGGGPGRVAPRRGDALSPVELQLHVGSRLEALVEETRRLRGGHAEHACAAGGPAPADVCLLYTSDAADDLLCV